MDTYLKYLLFGFVLVFVALPILGILMREPGQVEQEHSGSLPVNAISLIESAEKTHDDAMVLIPKGKFTQGNILGGYDEKPQKTQFLEAFLIDKYEVTNQRYMRFVEETGYRAPTSRYGGMEAFQSPAFPVVYVSWYDASSFCKWEGKRLPTESEWEKAARGPEAFIWPWGNDMNSRYANVKGEGDGVKYTAKVGAFKTDQSMYGALDMGGNVREWVNDWYDQYAYRDYDSVEVINAATPTTRSLRGGSWTDSMMNARATARFKMLPKYRDTAIGFRCVKSVS